MRRVRLVIADRRPIVLQGFVSLLGAQPDFEVVACCLDGASCLAAIRRLTPDVVLLEDGPSSPPRYQDSAGRVASLLIGT